MAQDKNGSPLKAGQRILVIAIVQNAPNDDGPVTVRIGSDEHPGNNISVSGRHVIVHPQQPQPLTGFLEEDSLVMNGGTLRNPLPPAGWLEAQEAARKESLTKGGQTSPPELVAAIEEERRRGKNKLVVVDGKIVSQPVI